MTPVKIGGHFVKPFTRRERRQWFDSMSNGFKDCADELLLARCLVNEDGTRRYSDDAAKDGTFDDWDSGDADTVIRFMVDRCGLGRSDWRDLEELVKNYSAAPANNSATS